MRVISGDAEGINAAAARAALSVASVIYGVGCRAKWAMYDLGVARVRGVGATVISIGNITAGGTGKTPATIYFARKYSAEGRRVAVVSRGYGRTTRMHEPLAVSEGERILLSPRESGDEPYLIAKKVPGVPVIVCASRTRGAEFAIKHYRPDIILLDDGFQHIAIVRDEDVVVVDCTNPFGFGRLLPRGLLREPMSALGRATRFLLTRADECDCTDVIRTLEQVNPTAEILRSRHRPVRLTTLEGDGAQTLDFIKGKSALAVSSIGNPKAFETTLGRIGVGVVGTVRFNDHHWYDADDIERIRGAARKANAAHIISTEKDGVRLGLVPNAPTDMLLLEIELEMME